MTSAYNARDHVWPELTENSTLDRGSSEMVHTCKRISDNKFIGGRSKHTVVAYKEALYVFGGADQSKMLNDLLRFDVEGNSWNQVSYNGTPPAPRYHHSAVIHENSMYVFGGFAKDIYGNYNSEHKNDLYEYKFTTQQWINWSSMNTKPPARSGHGAVVHGGKLWIFAGFNGNTKLNDMWTLSLSDGSKVWSKVTQAGERLPTFYDFPVAVACDSMFVLSDHSGATIANNIYQFRFSDFTWTRLSTEHILRGIPSSPASRHGHTMAAYDTHLFVFGGAANAKLPNDLHCFDLDTQTWSIVTPTSNSEILKGRLFHAAAVVDNAIYVFGETVNDSVRNREMYQFKLSSYPKCTLRDDFGKLLESKEFCDVEFLLGENGYRVEAHLAIVTARSQYLATEIRLRKEARDKHLELLLKTKETSSDVPLIQVKLPKAIPEAFKLVLNYIYTDKIELTKRIDLTPDRIVFLIIDVYHLACELLMKRLEQLCIHYLKNVITHQNVLSALHYALNLKLSFIEDYCLKFIIEQSNFSQIIFTKEFESIEKELMIHIIRRQIMPQRSLDSVGTIEAAIEVGSIRTSLEEDMEVYLKNNGKDFCDIMLKLEDTLIPAHKAILAARCSYFQGMFRSFMPTDKTVNIQICEIVPSHQSFDSLLRFIYYGDVNMPPEDSIYLLSAPYFYGFTNNRLNAFCKQNLIMNISIEYVLPLLEVADSISANDMKKHALRVIVQNFEQVAKLTQIKSLSRDLLLDILEALAVEMSEKRNVNLSQGK